MNYQLHDEIVIEADTPMIKCCVYATFALEVKDPEVFSYLHPNGDTSGVPLHWRVERAEHIMNMVVSKGPMTDVELRIYSTAVADRLS